MVQQRKSTRFFTRPPFWIGLLGLLLAIPIGQRLLEGPDLPTYQTLPSFSFVDQEGQPFGLEQLKGEAWVANFIFTTCPTVCPLLTQKMATLESRSRHLGGKVHFVSFSVDPENDTPEVLKAFGQEYGQDPLRWSMVTGPVEEIENTIIDSFKIAVTRPDSEAEADDLNMFEIAHGEHFVLVDGAGRIRGYYSNDLESHERLLADLNRLAKRPGGGA